MKQKTAEKTALKVLCLEDSPRDVEIISELLIDAGFDLTMDCTEKKKEYVSLLRSRKYDIILSDFKLPGFDAFGALKLSIDICPAVPFVCVSGTIGEETAIDLIKQGAVDYVLKDRLVQLPLAIKRALNEVKEKESRRQAEIALRESKERYRALYEDNPSMYFTLDPAGTVLSVNRFGCEQLGYTASELVGQSVLKVFHEEDKDAAARSVAVCAENPGQMFHWELRKVRKTGSLMWVKETARAIRGPDGQVVVFIVCEDITERKRAEEKVNQLAAIVKSSEDAIIGKTLDGIITSWNKGAEKIYGFAESEVIGKSISLLVPPESKDELPEILARLRSGEHIEQYETIRRRKDGREIQMSLTISPIRDIEGKIVAASAIGRDIAERKNAEIALRESQQMLRTVLDTVPARVFWKDKNGIYLGCNLPFAKDSGFNSPDEIVGKDDFQMGWREEAELYRADDRQVIESSIPKLAYEEPQSFDEGIRWLRTSKIPLRNAEDEIIGILGTYEDVTEAKQSALLLAHERYLLNALLENTVDSIYFKDTEGRFTRVSATTMAKRGLNSTDQLLGKTDFDFFAKERAQEMYEQEQEIIRTHKPVVDVEVQELWTDRPPTWASVTKVPLYDQAGKITGLFGVSRDITERKNAEIALRNSEEKFRGLVEGSAAAIWIHDVERFIYVNPAALEMTGYTAEELYRVAPREIVHPDFREFVMKRALERIEGKDVPKHYEYQIMKKSGEAIWIYSSGAAIDYQGKSAIIASAYDITGRKKLEEQLLQAQKMEGIGKLAGGIAHDYNNMLGVIIGYSSLIMKKVDKSEPIYRYFELIASAAKRAADITRQLLAFARREIVSPRVLDPNKAIESLQQMLQRLIGENVKLRFLPEKSIWNIKIDPTQLDQILVNLATNARDAIDDVGTITIETSNASIDEAYAHNRIDFSPGEYVMISFTDTGKGMSKEVMGKIFEPFFTTKSKGQGTGLGLSTVYGIVKQNGGSIDVYSETSIGTTFRIYLPRHQGELEEPEAAQVEEPTGGTETVLIVEDQADLLELAKNSLEEFGYKALTALSPGEGILLCEEYQDEIHLLLTDVIMPVMNGKELRDKILTMKPDIKTVFMSGYTANVIADRGVLGEGVDFIQKPFTPYALAKKVHDALKSRVLTLKLTVKKRVNK